MEYAEARISNLDEFVGGKFSASFGNESFSLYLGAERALNASL